VGVGILGLSNLDWPCGLTGGSVIEICPLLLVITIGNSHRLDSGGSTFSILIGN